MVFQRTVIIEPEEDGIKGFRKPLSNQAKCLFNRDIAALRRVNNAGQPLILEFLPRIAVIRSFFAGKWRKMSASFSRARRAIDAVVVPLNPRAAKSSRAAARIRSRLESRSSPIDRCHFACPRYSSKWLLTFFKR